MAEHTIEIIKQYNPILKFLVVLVDSVREFFIFANSEDEIDDKLADLKNKLDNEDYNDDNEIKKYSKFDICLELKKLGLLNKFQQWLEENDYEFLFTQAQILSTDNKMFSDAISVVQNELELSDEQINDILQKSEVKE